MLAEGEAENLTDESTPEPTVSPTEQKQASSSSEVEKSVSSKKPKGEKATVVKAPTATAAKKPKAVVAKKPGKSSKPSGKRPTKKVPADGNPAKYPRHTVEKALRVPRAIIDQNAGRECSDRDAAAYASVGYNGPFRVELSSAIKYGFLVRPKAGHVGVTERARQALRPQSPGDEIKALRDAVMDAPDISTVYKHYRGENLPDGQFFANALTDKFGIPAEKISEFKEIFETRWNQLNL